MLALAAGAVLGKLGAPDIAQAAGNGWTVGDASASIVGGSGQTAGQINITANGDLDIVAHHMRMGTYDGNYEFEHSHVTSQTTLNSYYIGTPTRTSVSVGGNDGQDVLSFIVRGKSGQKNDLQQWIPGDTPTLAVDGHGRLRMGQVTLSTAVVDGHVELIATLPGGKRHVLARS